MLSQAERNQIIDLINREVVPAIGCTEPIAVALCTARAAETLGGEPEKITVRLSANILKNAMGVGIPGTGMIGLPIAVALGALVGRSEYQLEVLRDVTPEAVERVRRMIDGRRIAICLKEDVDENLYIEAEAEAAGHRAVAVIAGGHTSFVFVSRDGETLLDRRTPAAGGGEEEDVPLTLARVWDFAMTSPLDELRFILETSRLNKAAAERSFAGEFGHCVGRTLCCDRERKVMGDSIFTRILSYTSAACDARMAGAMIPVMSNSGSGNQGITASMPVYRYAERIGATKEQLYRALAVSDLITIHQKTGIGRLSAYCGAISAGVGAGAGICYLLGGGFTAVAHTVVNAVAILSGTICDGAKPSCAAKIAAAVDAGIMGYRMYLHHREFQQGEGIVAAGVDSTIANIGTLAKEGMLQTDQTILSIMTGQQPV